MPSSVPVSIVAMGARTPVGLAPASAAAAIRAGISRVGEHDFFVDDSNEPLRGATDARLDPALMGWQRLAALAHSALDQVATEIGPCSSDSRIALLVASPELRPGWVKDDERQLVDSLEQRGFGGRSVVPTIVGRGHAGALHAIHQAVDLINRRAVEVAVVCGVDSYFHPETVRWLLENRQWVRRDIRGGFFPGEAAGAVALASTSAARRLRLPTHARVAGTALTVETARIKQDADQLGTALAEAIRVALAKAGDIDAPIDNVFCDLNGERYRTEEWGFALLRGRAAFRDPTAYEAPSDRWGDVGAASGTLLTILAVQAWKRRYARGPRTLIFAGSEAGHRSAVVLTETSS
jgi:3-oxoacyl-[acyl-carrier-protein] synthase-1